MPRLTKQEIAALNRRPDVDVEALVLLLVDYFGPTPEPELDELLNTDRDLRRRALAIAATFPSCQKCHRSLTLPRAPRPKRKR